MKLRTVGIRGAAVAAAALAILAASGAPALAHVKVTADKPQAGATAVTVTFAAESESQVAGIASLRTFLPPGLAPADVQYVSGPPGWAFTPQPDGFTVGGPPLRPGENAAYAIRLAKIPAGLNRLPLRTVQRYANGQVDKWLDTTKSVEQEEANAAPALTLSAAGAAPDAPAAGAPPEAGAAPAAGVPNEPGALQSPAAGRQGLAPAFTEYPQMVWIVGGAALVVALGLIMWVRSRLY